MPRVSIVLPTYNSAPYLAEAIGSILRQTYSDFELVVVDDGSTDETSELLSACRDRRIRFVRNDRNRGIVAALNRGLELSDSEVVGRMDADEVAEPRRLEWQVAFLKANHSVGLLGTRVRLIDIAGRACRSFPGGLDLDRPTQDGAIRHRMMFLPTLAHATVMFRRAVLDACGGAYRGVNGFPEDYELWLRMIRVTQVAILPRRLMRIRMNPGGLQATRRPELLAAHMRLAASAVEFLVGRTEPALPFVLDKLFFAPITRIDSDILEAFQIYLAITNEYLAIAQINPRAALEIRRHGALMILAMIRAQPTEVGSLRRLWHGRRALSPRQAA